MRWALAGLVLVAVAGCGQAAGQPAAAPSSPAASASASVTASASSAPGDAAPHEAENNAWKQTGEVSPADRRAARAAVAELGPVLARLRAEGDLSVDALRIGLADAGYPEVDAQSLADRTSLGDPPPGAAFGVPVGDTACIVGSLQATVITPAITGRGGSEFTCLEPFSH